MKLAIKFWSQSNKNPLNFPGNWPWKKLDILDEEQPEYESAGFTVMTAEEFEDYKREEMGHLYKTYLEQKSDTYKYLDISIDKKIAFANDLIARMKKKNISDGINALQGLWMHQKVRAMPVTFYGMTFTIDLMNLVVSGDLEIACISLMYSPADDMTQPFHWFSTDRKNFLINELKAFLGWA